MSSTAPTKRDRAPNSLSSKTGLVAWFSPLVSSSVGSKVVVALTGFALTGFVIVHLIGNLKIFGGPDSINAYAEFLKSNPFILWGARGTLLGLLALHMFMALRLAARSQAARPVAYEYQNTVQASIQSRIMVHTGLLVFAFIVFHILHYTVAVITTAPGDVNYLTLKDAHGRHDVYRMMIAGFQTPWVSIAYLVAQAILFLHLSHGVGSIFQTLGLNTQRTQPFIALISWGVPFLIFVGNSAIVLAVWLKYLV